MKLGGATFLGRGPPPTHRLHTTQYTLSVWRDQDIKISDTSKVGQGGGGCGADLEPCVTVLPRVGAGAGYTLPTNQIYLVFSVTLSRAVTHRDMSGTLSIQWSAVDTCGHCPQQRDQGLGNQRKMGSKSRLKRIISSPMSLSIRIGKHIRIKAQGKLVPPAACC